jgi:membrane-associated phospholipid phosphatase
LRNLFFRVCCAAGILFFSSLSVHAQETLPVSYVFHNFGWNTLNSLFYNYGLNLSAAAAGTYVFIESGLDWQYNRLAWEHGDLAWAGVPSLYIGYVVPLLLPGTLYLIGGKKDNIRLEAAGLALAQSLFISISFPAIMKGITGHISPGIIDVLDHKRSENTADYSGDFDWGFGNRGFIAGWPSSHTTTAFAFAAALSEIYHEKTLLKAASYSYAVFIALGVSLCVHWSSEVLAGVLIGYAIGKTVGRDFRHILEPGTVKNAAAPFSFYFTFDSVGVRIAL